MYKTLIVICIFLISCAPKIKSVWITDLTDIPSLKKEGVHNCNDPLFYFTDSMTSMRYIRVNVHFIDDKKGDKNFSLEDGKIFFDALLDNANQRLAENKKMNLPEGNETPVLETKYRYQIAAQSNDVLDNGYYKHFDDELYYFINKGKNKNNYDRKVVDKYGIGTDSIINIFVLPHHPDSVKSETYKVSNTGIALGTALKMAGLVEGDKEPWKYATLLNHEVGHILGLSHSWLRYDRCDDTPEHNNCWSQTEEYPCDGISSNNMMDYNAEQMALTPCQLGIIHKGLSKTGSHTRKLLIKDWCHLEGNTPIVIDKETHWQGSRDITRNIIVKSMVDLHIYCRISMPKNGKIILEPGAKLILHDALLHNDCDLLWSGIELQSKNDLQSEIITYGNSKITNCNYNIK